MGKLCRLYKHIGINRFDQHDTARTKDCSRFLLNQEEMDDVLKHFESLSKSEYTDKVHCDLVFFAIAFNIKKMCSKMAKQDLNGENTPNFGMYIQICPFSVA